MSKLRNDVSQLRWCAPADKISWDFWFTPSAQHSQTNLTTSHISLFTIWEILKMNYNLGYKKIRSCTAKNSN